MIEELKPVRNYEKDYLISSSGDVISIKNGKRLHLKQMTDRGGYLYVNLRKNGGLKHSLVHRLVADAFLPKIDGKEQVNHINGIRTDNDASNLEWCSSSENNLHKYRVLGYDSHRKMKVRCVENGKIYGSLREAANDTCSHESKVSLVVNGLRKTTNGLHFQLV